MIKKMNEKERKEPPKERVVEKGGPTIPLGRQIELEVKLEDGTFFRHPKKEGIDPTAKHTGGKKCVKVSKQSRCTETGLKVKIATRRFYYTDSAGHRAALRRAVRFRDGLWAEVAAGKSSEQLKKWVADWTEDKDKKSEDVGKKQ